MPKGSAELTNARREKYDLHMKVERYVSDEKGLPEEDMKFIKR